MGEALFQPWKGQIQIDNDRIFLAGIELVAGTAFFQGPTIDRCAEFEHFQYREVCRIETKPIGIPQKAKGWEVKKHRADLVKDTALLVFYGFSFRTHSRSQNV